MPLAIEHGARYVAGDKRHHLAVVKLSGTYAADGFDVEASDFGLAHLDSLIVGTGNRGRQIWWNESDSKLKLYGANGSEHADGTISGTSTAHVIAIGV